MTCQRINKWQQTHALIPSFFTCVTRQSSFSELVGFDFYPSMADVGSGATDATRV